jgi:hypothetical protein
MYVHSFDYGRITMFQQDILNGAINLHVPRFTENNLESAMNRLHKIDGIKDEEWIKTMNLNPRGKEYTSSTFRNRWGSPL